MLKKFNSVQLNIVTFVDVQKATESNSLDGCVYIMDNSPNSKYQGTPKLRTVCKQGQILNWIIYAMDADKRPDGKWPPSVRINNIVFLGKDGEETSGIKICSDLKVYGPPDKMRAEITPNYYYWAGTVLGDLNPGVYKYRFIIELETENPSKKLYLNLDTPSLEVINMY